MEIKRVRPSHPDSYERLCHDAGVARFLLDPARNEALRRRLIEPRLERFIGVIYRPDTELMSHYAERLAGAAIRRLRLVRRDRGGDRARARTCRARRARYLPVRAVSGPQIRPISSRMIRIRTINPTPPEG